MVYLTRVDLLAMISYCVMSLSCVDCLGTFSLHSNLIPEHLNMSIFSYTDLMMRSGLCSLEFLAISFYRAVNLLWFAHNKEIEYMFAMISE